MKRLLSLIEKTGDRLVITDPAGEHPYVLMGLDHYEKLVVGEWKPDVTKHDPHPPQTLPMSTGFPDNKPPKREIPLWKSEPAAPPAPPSAPPTPPPARQPTLPVTTPAALNRPKSPFRTATPPPAPDRPSVPAQQEIAQDVAEGEERFYLEPLE